MYIFVILLFISIAATYLVRNLALKKKIIDNPNERSSHTVPTPRGGGLAIVIVWLLGLAYFFWQGKIEQNLFFALLSGIVLAIVSALDDVLDLTPKVRMLAQAVSTGCALYFLGGFNLLPENSNLLVLSITSALAFVGIIWFINLYNFLDGIDAYASQETILVASGMMLLSGNYLLALLVAATGGFLVWNWPKAKIFMGDVGSTQLGFVLVVFGIYYHNQTQMSIWLWLALTSLFWFDASYTLFTRWRNKEQLSKAHRKHAYQRLTRAGWSHLKVDLHAIFINLLIIGGAWLVQGNLVYELVFLVGVAIMLLFLIFKVNKIFPFPRD